MIKEKIDLCVKELEKSFGKVSSIKTKYLTRYGFASVYFKVSKSGQILFIPALIVPDEEEDAEEFTLFSNFLDNTGLSIYLKHLGVLDIDSIVSILEFVEYERYKSSGKKALHLDLSEHAYEKSIRKVIEDYLVPFGNIDHIRCIYNKSNHNLVIVDDVDNEYFNEAREFLGI